MQKLKEHPEDAVARKDAAKIEERDLICLKILICQR
jgi:hypothetical protein